MVCCGVSQGMQQQGQPGRPQRTTARPVPPVERGRGRPQEQPREREPEEPAHFRLRSVSAGIKRHAHLPTLLVNRPQPADGEGVEKKPPPTSGLLSGLVSGKTRSFCSSEDSSEPISAAAEGNLLGALVQKLVASFDASRLGVKVHIESMKLQPLSGTIEVHGLLVDNPPGFRSAYLLRAEKVAIRVNTTRLIGSLGGTVEIDEIDLADVDVIYEKALATSNLKALLAKVSDGSDGGARARRPRQSTEEETKLMLHKISVRNVGAKVCSSLMTMAGPRLAIGDIHFEDFHKTSGGAKKLMQVVKLVLETLIKSILASVLGKKASEGMTRAATGLRSRVTHGFSQALSHVPNPLARLGLAREAAAPEVAVPTPATTWCGCTAPLLCCQQGLPRQEPEVVVRQ
uniref:Uncharacterized protein n=1 Tax=Alexandrium monilatum TaxID=311494 RepID=A0A7S4QSF0_9DINO